MFGAILGDIVDTPYEFKPHKSKDFELFSDSSKFTDDTVLTIAVCNALLKAPKNASTDIIKRHVVNKQVK